jgi:hypothetical protein
MFTHQISTAQLDLIKQLTVFDCRHDLMQPSWGRAQYEAAHLPFALFASLDDDLSATKTGRNGRHPLPSREAFVQWLADRGVNSSTQIVCYDQLEGMYAARMWWMCRCRVCQCCRANGRVHRLARGWRGGDQCGACAHAECGDAVARFGNRTQRRPSAE